MNWGWVIGLTFVAVLTACGRDQTAEEAAAFAPYLERFNGYAQQFGGKSTGGVKVYFGALQAGEVGVCEQSLFYSPRITVARSAWNQRDDMGREALLFHELGHCVLGRDHKDEGATRQGRRFSSPSSIMNTNGVSTRLYAQDHEYYIRELFTGR